MADKRMFSRQVTETDDFNSLSKGAQSLWFHLSMEADDDGVVSNAFGTMARIGATDAEMDELIQTGYLLRALPKVFVIRHWKVCNSIPASRYHKSRIITVKEFFDERDGVYEPKGMVF